MTHVNLCFLHMFSLVAPKFEEFPEVVMEELILLDGLRGTRPLNTYKPQAWR